MIIDWHWNEIHSSQFSCQDHWSKSKLISNRRRQWLYRWERKTFLWFMKRKYSLIKKREGESIDICSCLSHCKVSLNKRRLWFRSLSRQSLSWKRQKAELKKALRTHSRIEISNYIILPWKKITKKSLINPKGNVHFQQNERLSTQIVICMSTRNIKLEWWRMTTSLGAKCVSNAMIIWKKKLFIHSSSLI